MTVNLSCSDPLHASRSAQPGWAAVLGTGAQAISGLLCQACVNDPTGAYQTARAQTLAVSNAGDQQSAAVANILSGAAAIRTDLTNQAATLNTAAATLTTALNATNLPNAATTLQMVTAIRAVGTYLTANKTAIVAIGSDLDQTVKGLANLIAKQSGSTTVFT